MNPETQGDSSVILVLTRGLLPENPSRLHDGRFKILNTYIKMLLFIK